MTKIKICCISSIDEANLAIESGADVLGLVGPMPSGPGIISLEQISRIVAQIPDHVDTCLLTSAKGAKAITDQIQLTGVSKVQIVDDPNPDVYENIRNDFSDLEIVQVIHVENQQSIRKAQSLDGLVDFLLLDSGSPSNGVLGGTGNTHNWEISKQLVESCNTPVFLAGGLRAENIQKAIEKVRPYGVDLCSGVRTENKLDAEKLKTFIHQVKSIV